MSLLWITLLFLFIVACIVYPIFFMDSREPIVRLDFDGSPLKVNEQFNLDNAILWLNEQAQKQDANRFIFALVNHGTYMTHQEPELFEIEKKIFVETGNCHLVFITGPGQIHEWHFHVKDFSLKEISEKWEPITLP